jgi:hypothetical protein
VSSDQTKPSQIDVSSNSAKPSVPTRRRRQMSPPSFASRPVAAGWCPMFLIQDLVVPHHVLVLVLVLEVSA